MSPTERLQVDRRRSTQLIDALYGMDLRAPDWNPFLDQVAQAFRSHVVTVQVHDHAHRHGQLMMAVGLSSRLMALHPSLSYEHPWFERGAYALLLDGIADDRGLMPESELRATRFYAEFMDEARIGHGMALCMHARGREDMALLTINRDWRTGHYSEQESELARSLLPHLCNAYALQQRLGWLRHESQSFHAALDQLTDGVLLLNARGQLKFCNVVAQQMEADHLFARRPDGRLCLHWPADEQLLRRTLPQLCASQATRPFIQPLHARDGVVAGTIKFCPAGMVAGTQWSEFDIRVIAFVKSVAPGNAACLRTGLQDQWGFTTAEAQLAQWMMQGMSLAQAAERGGVTINTMRTHLRSLFDKTQTRRQAELVRLLLRLSHT
ncbi:helix-turn-helix transcriptional regulator [Rhodanobacter umsongensis]|uniref:Helix-turn-helix transcriptional regulator n=1 Tax=Rhodanobacter umsongensis TaxID=633153 RepID=A0ABW0JG27_9GAMM